MGKLSLAKMSLPHGYQCVCPRCGTPGRFERQLGKFNDWVRFTFDMERFECHQCEDR